MALPQRARVAVAVADVQRPGHRHARGDHVDRRHGRLRRFRVAGQERLVDLQQLRPAVRQGAGLGVEHAGDGQDEVAAIGVGVPPDPPGQRERAGEGELDRGGRVRRGEREVVRQPQRRAARRAGPLRLRERLAERGLVVVEVEILGRVPDLDPRHPGQEVVDVVVPAQLAVGHDVDPGPLLVVQGGLDRHLVHVEQLGGAHPAPGVLGLEPLHPFRHRVGADDGGRQQGHARQHGSAGHVSLAPARSSSRCSRRCGGGTARTPPRTPGGGPGAPAAGRSPS